MNHDEYILLNNLRIYKASMDVSSLDITQFKNPQAKIDIEWIIKIVIWIECEVLLLWIAIKCSNKLSLKSNENKKWTNGCGQQELQQQQQQQ